MDDPQTPADLFRALLAECRLVDAAIQRSEATGYQKKRSARMLAGLIERVVQKAESLEAVSRSASPSVTNHQDRFAAMSDAQWIEYWQGVAR